MASEDLKVGQLCECGSRDTWLVPCGGFQEADASRNMPMIESDGMVYCKTCGRTWWD